MKLIMILLAIVVITPSAVAGQEEKAGYQQPAVEQQQALSDEEVAEAAAIFERLVADYRNDPMAISGYFGIKVADHYWSVTIDRKEKSSKRGRLTDHESPL